MADRTAKARLRDAAIELVGQNGLDRLTARRVAELAGVTAGLIRHHFGSMEGLRRACDAHVASIIRRDKEDAIERVQGGGAALDPLRALREADSTHLVSYLAAVLTEDSEIVRDLVDTLVSDAEAYLRLAETAGHVRPTEDPRRRAAVILLWSLGALVLHRHAQRLLDVDLTDLPASDPTSLARYAAASTDLLGTGLYTPAFAAQMHTVLTKELS
jgi:AcrR family transcriptional regulator